MKTFLDQLAAMNPAALAALAVLAAIASAIAAIVSAIVSPLITANTTKKQIRASLISANRQAWINSLREELSELLELFIWVHTRIILVPSLEGANEEAKKLSRIRRLIRKIELELNPAETKSKELMELLKKLQVATHAKNSPELNFETNLDAAVSKAQEIFKAEWERVKRGE
jgi:NifB/MoaA-like Fe-S oxidoreductase